MITIPTFQGTTPFSLLSSKNQLPLFSPINPLNQSFQEPLTAKIVADLSLMPGFFGNTQ